jgi:hypothetical protein
MGVLIDLVLLGICFTSFAENEEEYSIKRMSVSSLNDGE